MSSRSYDGVDAANVRVVDSLRTACGPELARTLARTPEALWLYGAAIELQPSHHPSSAIGAAVDVSTGLLNDNQIMTNADHSITFYSNGSAELVVCTNLIDTEQRSVLTLDCAPITASHAAKVEMMWTGEPMGTMKVWFVVGKVRETPFQADLAGVPAFVLNQRITDVRLRFLTPGVYQLKSCRF